MRRTKGFTLIELLVVIAIIGLLVSILVPSVTRVQALAKRVSCQANLNGLGKAITIYKSMNDDDFPIIDQSKSSEYMSDLGGTVDEDANGSLAGLDGAMVQNLCLLIKEDNTTWKMFRCPAVSGRVMTRDGTTNRDYGFKDADDNIFCDYALHMGYEDDGTNTNPAPFTKLSDSVPIMGDVATDGTNYAPTTANPTGYAGNHGKDGTNMLKGPSNVAFYKEDIDTIGVDEDNPYTNKTGTNTNSTDGPGLPFDDKDSVLIEPS